MKATEATLPQFVRLIDVMRLYSVGRSKATELVKESRSGHKIGQMVLVDTEKLNAYIRSFETIE